MAKRKNDMSGNEEEELLWYKYDLADPKDLSKAIVKLKNGAKSTLEYEVWARQTKQNKNTDNSKCRVCGEYYNFIKADTHHHPKTISEVIEDVINEEVMKNTMVDNTYLDMLQKIMMKHFLKDVDYIVLCTHCHEKYHNNDPVVFNKVKEIFKKQLEDNYLDK